MGRRSSRWICGPETRTEFSRVSINVSWVQVGSDHGHPSLLRLCVPPDPVQSKFRDARPATKHSQAGAVTVCKLCDPGVFGIH